MGRVYAESLFLLLTVLAISKAYDERWWWAGFWGAGAAVTRPNGILIALPLVLLALRGRPALRQLSSRLLALAIVPAALVAYSVYVYTLTGDPIGWLSAQNQWGYSLGHPPWQQLTVMINTLVDQGYGYFFTSENAPIHFLHGIAALVFLCLTPAVFRRFGAALGAYVLVSMLVPLTSNSLEGLGRYASTLFPAFMLVGTLTTPRLHEAIVMVALVFRTLLVCFFVTREPIY